MPALYSNGVRYFLTRRLPEAESLLLVESGSRSLLEGLIPHLRETWGIETPIDLVTCYSKLPSGLDPPTTRVYRVNEYPGREGRRRMFREIAARRYPFLGIVCSGEPILTKWKWGLAFLLKSKVFIINENGDYFWLDWGHFGPLREFVFLRSGFAGSGAVRTLARLVAFPFTFLYLVLYATTVHVRRALRRG
jgi:hypothetical protein